MNKRGFTLMELLVYMAIVGIIVVVAGKVYSDSTRMRIRTQSMIKSNQVAETVGLLLKDDIAQMGAKSAIDTDNSTTSRDAFVLKDSVFIGLKESTPDSSSFNLNKNEYAPGLDSLTFRKIQYTEAGDFLRVEEISLYAKTDWALYRSCRTVDGTEDAVDCPKNKPVVVQIAEGVTKFSVTPAKPGVVGEAGLVFPRYSDASKKTFRFVSYYGTDNYNRVVTSPVSGGESIRLSGLTSNYSADGSTVTDPVKHLFFAADAGSSTDGWSQCKPISIQPDSTYEISFEMANSDDETRMFQPSLDHFAVGIREVGETAPLAVPEVPDFYFYPPENDDGIGKRVMRFKAHVPAAFNACIAFSLALWSPTVALGSFSIMNLRMRRVGDYDYAYDESYDPMTVDKKNIRALRLNIQVKKNGETGNAVVEVPVPSNGIGG